MKIIFLALACLAAAPCWSQAYPSKPIQVVSSGRLGSGGDIALRLLAARMSESLGQTMVVEVRSGGAGNLAAAAVMRAAPDGHTLLYGTMGMLVTNRFFVKNVPFDSSKDFAPISRVFSIPSFLVVNAAVPAANVKELFEHAKKNPRKLVYGSTGPGSPFHLLGEAFKMTTGVDMVHAPYGSGGSALTIGDLIAGRMHVYFPSYAAMKPAIASGKVRVLAVIEDKRSRLLPDVPTVNETLPDFHNVVVWYAFLGPVGMPRPVVDRLATEARRGLQDPSISAKLDELGIVTLGTSPEELSARLKSDVESIGKVVKALGLQPQ